MRIISQANVNGAKPIIIQDGERFFSVSYDFYYNVAASFILVFFQ